MKLFLRNNTNQIGIFFLLLVVFNWNKFSSLTMVQVFISVIMALGFTVGFVRVNGVHSAGLVYIGNVLLLVLLGVIINGESSFRDFLGMIIGALVIAIGPVLTREIKKGKDTVS